MFKVIGLPTPETYHKKFLLAMPPGQFDLHTPSKVKKEVFHVIDTFLIQTSSNTEAFLRKYGKNDSFIYNHEVKIYKNKERIQTKRQITAREYIEICEQQKAPGFKELQKFRQCFIYEQDYFMVETFLNCDGQPSLLRIETNQKEDELKLPKFCKVVREVTEDNLYAASNLARIGWKFPEEDKKKINALLKQQKPMPQPP